MIHSGEGIDQRDGEFGEKVDTDSRIESVWVVLNGGSEWWEIESVFCCCWCCFFAMRWSEDQLRQHANLLLSFSSYVFVCVLMFLLSVCLSFVVVVIVI